MRLSSRIFSVLLVGLSCLFAGPQSKSQVQSNQYLTIPGDLANALAQMARASRVPIIAELAQPLPNVIMADGVKVSGLLEGYTAEGGLIIGPGDTELAK